MVVAKAAVADKAETREEALDPVDIVFAQNAEKKYHINRV